MVLPEQLLTHEDEYLRKIIRILLDLGFKVEFLYKPAKKWSCTVCLITIKTKDNRQAKLEYFYNLKKRNESLIHLDVTQLISIDSCWIFQIPEEKQRHHGKIQAYEETSFDKLTQVLSQFAQNKI